MQNVRHITPRQLAEAIGVSESSLKRWTDKGLLAVNRTAGGHRRITLAAAVQFLRRSKTPLVNPAVLGLDSEFAVADLDDAPMVEQLTAALVCGDLRTTQAILIQSWAAGRDAVHLCDALIRPAMSDVGAGWEAHRVDVFQEHRATQICLEILGELRAMMPPGGADAPVAIGGAPSGDAYTLPSAAVTTVLTELGWRAVNLGPDLPLANLSAAVRAERPRLAWVSMSVAVAPGSFLSELAELHHACRQTGAALILGGRGLIPQAAAVVGAQNTGTSMRDLADFVRRRTAPGGAARSPAGE